MNAEYKTLEDLRAKTPQAVRAPGDHPFAALAREYMKELSLNPEELESENESLIEWQFSTETEMRMLIRIYRDAEGEAFFHLEAAISSIDIFTELATLRWLAQSNSQLHVPFRLAVLPDNLVVAQCRSYCDGFTPAHFKLRLETLYPFSKDVQEILHRNFGLLPALHSKTGLKK